MVQNLIVNFFLTNYLSNMNMYAASNAMFVFENNVLIIDILIKQYYNDPLKISYST